MQVAGKTTVSTDVLNRVISAKDDKEVDAILKDFAKNNRNLTIELKLVPFIFI